MAETKDPDFGKKCAFTGKSIKRVRRYYRNGLYYVNKNAYMGHMKKLKEESQNEQEQSA